MPMAMATVFVGIAARREIKFWNVCIPKILRRFLRSEFLEIDF
jgi:hypothetical protein